MPVLPSMTLSAGLMGRLAPAAPRAVVAAARAVVATDAFARKSRRFKGGVIGDRLPVRTRLPPGWTAALVMGRDNPMIFWIVPALARGHHTWNLQQTRFP